MIPSTSDQLREANLARALRSLHRAGGELTRTRLARDLRVTRATAGALATGLGQLGLVVETAAAPTGRRGRPTTRLVPATDGPVVVTLELAVDAVRTAVVGLGGRVESSTSESLDRQDAGYVVELARAELHRVLRALGRRCAGVGVAVYGLVDHSSGGVIAAPNLGWQNVDLLAGLGLASGMPVCVDNVAHLAALAEARRAAGNMLYVHAAVGVGGALVLDGRPVRGRNGFAGEYGHLPLGHGDRPCRCGGRGCWETEVDQLALARAAGHRASAKTAAGLVADVLAAFAARDPVARQAVEQVGAAFGRGLGALVNVHDPDEIVLAGHASDLYEAVPARIERAMRRAVMRARSDRLPPIRRSALGQDGALLGAAEALFDDAIARPTVLADHVGRLVGKAGR